MRWTAGGRRRTADGGRRTADRRGKTKNDQEAEEVVWVLWKSGLTSTRRSNQTGIEAAGGRRQAAGGGRQAADGRRRAAGGRRRTADGGRRTAGGGRRGKMKNDQEAEQGVWVLRKKRTNLGHRSGNVTEVVLAGLGR